jgi:hypothetical protein
MPAAVSISTGTSPDELGNYFISPVPFRARGVWLYADIDYDMNLTLYSATDVILANCTVSSTARSGTSVGTHFVMFDSAPASTVDIAKDTAYRIVATATNANANIVRRLDVPEAAAMNYLSMGINCISTERTDLGAWTNTDTKRVIIGLIADQVHDGMGGGGTGGRKIVGISNDIHLR